MSIELKVTPEVLEQKASNISAQIADIEKAFQEVGNLITSSRRYWEGDASEAHQNYYNSYKDDMTAIIKSLKERPDNLLKMAGIYKETEAGAKAVAETLSADVII